MKIFKGVIIFLALVFIGAVVYFGVQDGNFKAEVTITINAPAEVVFDEVNDLKNWEHWATWLQTEKTTIYYPEKTLGKDAYTKWENDNIVGQITITESRPYTHTAQHIVFDETNTAKALEYTWTFTPTDDGSATVVTWQAQGTLGLFDKMKFAVRRQSAEKQHTEILTKSLAQLQKVVSHKTKAYTITVNGVRDYSGSYYLYINAVLRPDQVSQTIAEKAAQLHDFFMTNGLRPNGELFVLYHEWNLLNKTAVISVALPTKERMQTPDKSDVQSGFLPTQRVLKTSLKGDYSNLQETWNEAENYLLEHNLKRDNVNIPFEVYSIGKTSTKNPAEWLTEVYLPLSE